MMPSPTLNEVSNMAKFQITVDAFIRTEERTTVRVRCCICPKASVVLYDSQGNSGGEVESAAITVSCRTG